ncbi:MAG: hypothetical protein NZ837_06160, partial [Gammaproteobacteria bacterium]|nr:hypothetical protein [Gammaproteobacteria bacterium]
VSAEKKKEKIILRLAKRSGRLRTRDNQAPNGFELQDKQGQWSRAGARLVGDSRVELRLTPGQTAVAVRYAWSPFPEPKLNLLGEAGLPVAPFEAELSF